MVTGQGPQSGPIAGDLQIHGEGGRRPRVILKGSPEHNLLQEAQVLVGGSRSQEEVQEGRGVSGGLVRKKVRWPPDSGKEGKNEEGNVMMVGPSRVGKIPTSRASEQEGKAPRARLFPRE